MARDNRTDGRCVAIGMDRRLRAAKSCKQKLLLRGTVAHGTLRCSESSTPLTWSPCSTSPLHSLTFCPYSAERIWGRDVNGRVAVSLVAANASSHSQLCLDCLLLDRHAHSAECSGSTR